MKVKISKENLMDFAAFGMMKPNLTLKQFLLDKKIIQEGQEYELPKNLHSMRFTCLNFSGVDFSGVVLTKTTFFNCNLTKANMSGTLLDYADFRKSDLTDANFTGVSFRTLLMVEPMNVTGAKGLETLKGYNLLTFVDRTPTPEVDIPEGNSFAYGEGMYRDFSGY